MKADDVAKAVVAALAADTALTSALGGAFIYRAGANREPQIPSVEWRRITGTLAENTEVLLLQLDVWARGYSQAMVIEERIRAVLNRDGGPLTLGSLTLMAGMDDSRDHDDPEQGVAHTSQDYRFEPAKDEV